ncbi:MAG TPA: SH3 domain-containing protein [Bryobacteraceae bacterium]|nr:SH3 domain-containing protein [Bryobacteraceae bacterium]
MHFEGNGAFTIVRFFPLFAALLVLAGCGRDAAEVIGQAYVAPEKLNLRRELNEKDSTVAVLDHGDKVDIIDVRRRFVKVQTRKGQEGWVDSLQLLSREQMDQIGRDDERYMTFPPEGNATVYEALNIHMEPNRQSPAFARIAEGESFAVLAHKLAPKTNTLYRPPTFERAQPERRSRKQRAGKHSILPSPPPPPPAPANWQEMSTQRVDGAESTADLKARRDQEAADKAKAAAEERKLMIMEDWTLVRTRHNDIGWVLSRNLTMSIPDEVAQYAEGKRITSYFDLGSVQDEEKGLKHDWLWTTESEQEPNDFNAWRVFIWNRRRHRYETSYRQRDLEGYFPVHVDAPEAGAYDRTFEIITKDDDGKMRRRKYSFDGTRVHLAGAEEYDAGAEAESARAGGIDTNKLQSKMPHENWFRREFNLLKRGFSGV